MHWQVLKRNFYPVKSSAGSGTSRGRHGLDLLGREFYVRDTHDVARELLGKVLVREVDGARMLGRICEVEAYVGEDDAACHARYGRTTRTEVMYGEAGHAYVYLVYGMYDMLNFVTEREGFPAAVLIRGLVPIVSSSRGSPSAGGRRSDLQKIASPRLRQPAERVRNDALAGPGKLTRALQIDRSLNAHDLTLGEKLYVIDDGFVVDAANIQTSPRIGVEYAGEDAKLPWRYFLSDPNEP